MNIILLLCIQFVHRKCESEKEFQRFNILSLYLHTCNDFALGPEPLTQRHIISQFMQRISWISKLSIQFLTFFIGSKDVAPFFSFNGTYLIDRCPLVCVLQLTHAVFALVISHTITRHSPSRRHRQTFLQRFTNADKNIKKNTELVSYAEIIFLWKC